MKNILITGAAGGLGTALVREYLFRGFRVFAADLVPEQEALNIQSVILQRYLKPEGIRVLLINPGWMHTPMGGPDAPRGSGGFREGYRGAGGRAAGKHGALYVLEL